MNDDLDKLFNKYMKNLEFQKEYEALEPEYSIIQAIIEARKVSQLTEQELSEKTGIQAEDIVKLENGIANPTLSNLKKLADGMDMILKIEFIPKTQKTIINK